MPYHITHRGVRRSDVFWDDSDRLNYLRLFRTACELFHLRICAYCLMSNHVHFVAIPDRLDSIAKTFHWCHSTYDREFNRKYQLTGNLWEGRPFSALLDQEHLWAAVKYVEQNPVRAHMVEDPCDYEWSSAKAHCGLTRDALLDPDFPPPGIIPDWKSWLAVENDEKTNAFIRKRTAAGRPCGNQSFIASIEHLSGRKLLPNRRGRPSRSPNRQ